MSTNKTENCQLHAWEAGDDFLRSEFNENFDVIDGLLPQAKRLKIVVGSYTGINDSTLDVGLGFRPKAVYVVCKGGGEHHNLSIDGVADKLCTISNSGFTVSGALNIQLNSDYPYSGQAMNPYRYFAIGWEE